MQEQSYKCDICGKPKGAVNHWWLARQDEGIAVRIGSWNEPAATREGMKHLCGHECTHKMLDRFLTTGSLDANELANNERAVESVVQPLEEAVAGSTMPDSQSFNQGLRSDIRDEQEPRGGDSESPNRALARAGFQDRSIF